MHGEFAWNELLTRDPDGACRFYGELLGWTFDRKTGEDGAYIIARQGDKMVAGIYDMSGRSDLDHLPPHWFAYIAVSDLDAAFAKALDTGAKPIRPPFDIGEYGRCALLLDTTGAAIGLWAKGGAGC